MLTLSGKPKIKPCPSTAVVTFLLSRVGAEKCWGMGKGPAENGERENVPIPSPLSLEVSLLPQSLPIKSH